jgi:2-polyprenyl-3-methyl-5-hydroxy-6-metoxy-1,4-benzoquinol methylase
LPPAGSAPWGLIEPVWKGVAVPAANPRWNHNIHYHPLILAAVPPGCRTALDVGCGEGTLTRELRAVVPSVTGIDLDARSLEFARQHPDRNGVEYSRGDFLTHPFEPESFDMIVSVAALHHMDASAALGRMRALLRPGGVLALVGLARDRFPRDLPLALAGVVVHRWHRCRKGYWQHPAPVVWPPPQTYAEVRRTAARLLPEVRFRRHLLWRYSLLWTRSR